MGTENFRYCGEYLLHWASPSAGLFLPGGRGYSLGIHTKVGSGLRESSSMGP